jgi:predicted transposase
VAARRGLTLFAVRRRSSRNLAECGVVWYNLHIQRTIRIALTPSATQAVYLADTSRQFTSAFNQAVRLGWDAELSNATKLHYLVYYPLKSEHPTLVSDLINQARVKAAEARLRCARRAERSACLSRRLAHRATTSTPTRLTGKAKRCE